MGAQEKIIEVRRTIIELNEEHRHARQQLIVLAPTLIRRINSFAADLHKILERTKTRLSELADMIGPDP